MQNDDKQPTVTSPIEPVVSAEFNVTKKQSIINLRKQFSMCMENNDLVGASVISSQILAIRACNSH